MQGTRIRLNSDGQKRWARSGRKAIYTTYLPYALKPFSTYVSSTKWTFKID
jgi:hypothetical protein